uniref:Uncharacterized protein n=1 Tax=Euplotes crassus TaxID=5936 RepID=A0A7S3NRD1_EUPCR|mmetsp:Transcript_12967/g.12957  ORF Transcript_12967/g.12957 Transcript_12967/m.12957 type:complete len:696 (+) Transcript_12967:171-2258(+)
METHSTACISLDSDLLLYNYGIRLRTPLEKKTLNRVLHFRRMELRQQITGMETRANKILDQSLFSNHDETYIMNRIRGVQHYEVDEEAPIITQAKSATKRKNKIAQEEASKSAADGALKKGKRKPKVDLNQFRLGANKPKLLDEDDFDDKLKDRAQNRDESNIAELRWKIVTKKKELEDLKKDIHILGSWDLLYEPSDLYTDGRKKMQIEMLQDVVFALKQEYNKEFERFQRFKDDQIFAIQERSNRITEILEDLKREEELFHPRTHPLETPASILEVKPEEVTVQKYLTAEERAVEDEKHRIEQERLKALEGDNVGQRGIKNMLGGTYELKKNKGIMEETLEREEWMSKPIEDMTEDEKLKFKEFQQREKELQEEKDKKRKAWDQELKKNRIEIEEICFKFEDELKKIHKKRLYYDMRVYEQELYIIRLTLMLHENKEIKQEAALIAEKKDKLEQELVESKNTINNFQRMYEDFDSEFKASSAIAEQEKGLRDLFPNAPFRQILAFVRNGGKAANRARGFRGQTEENTLEQEALALLCKLDPYIIVDENAVKAKFEQENVKEEYSYDRDKIVNLTPGEFDTLVQERENRNKIDKERKGMEQEIANLSAHKEFCEINANDLEEAYEDIKASHTEIESRMEKLKYNFEAVVYMLQGQVEVAQAPVATDYKDAILVKTGVIEDENKKVVQEGNTNVK